MKVESPCFRISKITATVVLPSASMTGVLQSRRHLQRCTIVLRFGAGLHFRKYFEKFAGFVRREKFPKICRDRRVMGPSDPLKLLSDHSRPPGTNLKRPAVDMIYSILKDITLEGHQVPAYVWIWHFMWRRPSRRNPNLESYDRYIRRLHYL